MATTIVCVRDDEWKVLKAEKRRLQGELDKCRADNEDIGQKYAESLAYSEDLVDENAELQGLLREALGRAGPAAARIADLEE